MPRMRALKTCQRLGNFGVAVEDVSHSLFVQAGLAGRIDIRVVEGILLHVVVQP